MLNPMETFLHSWFRVSSDFTTGRQEIHSYDIFTWGTGYQLIMQWKEIRYVSYHRMRCRCWNFSLYRKTKNDIDYSDVIMGTRASQITSLTVVYSSVYSGTYQRKHQSSASLAFVRGIHRGPVNSQAQMASNAENVSIWWRHHGTDPNIHLSMYSI